MKKFKESYWEAENNHWVKGGSWLAKERDLQERYGDTDSASSYYSNLGVRFVEGWSCVNSRSVKSVCTMVTSGG